MDDQTVDAVVSLGDLTLKFAAINRAPLWPDGVTPESDTDHTVMLGLIACALAAKCELALDIGKIAQFSLVHDFVEVYAGDTNTFGMKSEKLHTEKAAREASALARIEKELSALPWIAQMIHEYESLKSPEARFVKVVDKVLPKVTRIVNNDANKTDLQELIEHCKHQREQMAQTYGSDQKIALALYDLISKRNIEFLRNKAT